MLPSSKEWQSPFWNCRKMVLKYSLQLGYRRQLFFSSSSPIWSPILTLILLCLLVTQHKLMNIATEMNEHSLVEESRGFRASDPDHAFLPDKVNDEEVPSYGKFLIAIGECCGFARTWMPCVCCFFVSYPYQTVSQGNEGLLTRFGRYTETVQPGLRFVNPCTDKLEIMDMRINVMDLERQNVITKDNIRLNIDCSVYFRVINARFAHFRIRQCRMAVAEISYAIIKNTCGQFVFQDILEKRAQIANDIEKQVDTFTGPFGIDVVDIFFKDIQLSVDLQNLLSSAAKEKRFAESKLISAKAEVECAKLMRTAAECLNSPAAIQMRYLESLKEMGNGLGKLVFVPKEGMREKVEHLITQGLIL